MQLFLDPKLHSLQEPTETCGNSTKSVRSYASACPYLNCEQLFIHVASTGGEKGFLVVILNEPAGNVKDLCFENERSFAAAQDDPSLRPLNLLLPKFYQNLTFCQEHGILRLHRQP